MKNFFKITEFLAYALLLSVISAIAFIKSGEVEPGLVILRCCGAILAVWFLCFIVKDARKEMPSELSSLILDHPYEVCTQWSCGDSQYAVFKPLVGPDEKYDEEKHRQRFIDLGCHTSLPDKYVVLTLKNGCFVFVPFPEEKVLSRLSPKRSYKNYERLTEEECGLSMVSQS